MPASCDDGGDARARLMFKADVMVVRRHGRNNLLKLTACTFHHHACHLEAIYPVSRQNSMPLALVQSG